MSLTYSGDLYPFHVLTVPPRYMLPARLSPPYYQANQAHLGTGYAADLFFLPLNIGVVGAAISASFS